MASPSVPPAPRRSAAATLPAGGLAPQPGTNHAFSLVSLTSLFFLWGFITCLNDSLIPRLKAAFALSFLEAGLIQFAFFTAYFVMSLPSGALVRRLGYQRGIVLGLLGAAAGCALFWPAAGLRLYPLFLGALFVLASGITLLQVAANPYVARLGAPESAPARLNLTQAFNSLGTTLAPQVGALLILGAAVLTPDKVAALAPDALAAYRATEAASVQLPYVGLAAIFVLIAVVFGLLKLPSLDSGEGGASAADYLRALRHPHLVFGVVAIFVYVGAEVSIGSFLINFMKLPEVAGFADDVGSRHLSYYWGGAMVGRFAGAVALRRFEAGKLLALNAVAAALLALSSMALSGHAAMWALLAIGLFNSIMFPTIFTLAVADLGDETPLGSGLLCMAIVGGALLPVATGGIADTLGLHRAFVLPALCYLFIAWYGARGSGRRLARPA